MLKGVVSGVALTLAVVLIGAYFLVQSGLIPANSDAKPGGLETWMARTSLNAAMRIPDQGDRVFRTNVTGDSGGR